MESKDVLPLMLGGNGQLPARVLALGAHSDDIEIGCGGTILRLSASQPQVEWCWVVFGATGARAREARVSARVFLGEATPARIVVHAFRDGFFPYVAGEIKDTFEELKATFSPDLILTHSRADLHQDHRLVAELTWNTFRDHLILEYEVPKYDGDLGAPNLFVHLDDQICQRKLDGILENFPSQHDKHWFTRDVFLGLLRLRGMESRSPSGFSEGFYCRKVVVSCVSS